MFPVKTSNPTPILACLSILGLLSVAGCGQSSTGPTTNSVGGESTRTSAVPALPAIPSATATNTQPAGATGVSPQRPAESPGVPPNAQQDLGPASTADGSSLPSASTGESNQFAAGKRVFESNGCAKCHSIGGSGGLAGSGPMAGGPRSGGPPGGGPSGGGPMGGGPMGKTKGPDLTKAGTKPGHTVEWFVEHIRNPKSHNPQSRMPPFADKIKDEDLRALAEYLASLK